MEQLLVPVGQRFQHGYDHLEYVFGYKAVRLALFVGEKGSIIALVKLCEKVHHIGYLVEYPHALLEYPAEYIRIHMGYARLLVPGHGVPCELLFGEGHYVLGVHPCELFRVEYCRGLAHAGNVEGLAQLGKREDLPVVAGVPAKERHVVHQCLLQIALVHKIRIGSVAVPL